MPNHDLEDYNRSAKSLFRDLGSRIRNCWVWLRSRVAHKLKNLRPSHLLDVLSRHGVALAVIIIGWEIVEDVVFPIIFAILGKYVHPSFYAGIPVAWIVCLHWFMVPLLWGMWVRYKGIEEKIDHTCGGCDENDH